MENFDPLENVYNRLHDLELENARLQKELEEIRNDDELKYKGSSAIRYFQSFPEGIFVSNTIYGVPTEILEVNDTFLLLLGAKRRNVLAADPLDFLAKGEKKKMLEMAEILLERKKIVTKIKFANITGEPILTETTFTVLDNSVNPQIICQVVQLSDKQKQNKLFFETDDYLKKVTEGTNEVIFRLRVLPRTIFEYISPAAPKVTGFSQQSFYSEPGTFLNNLHPNDYEELRKYLNNYKSTIKPLNVRFLRKDNKVIWLEIYLTQSGDAANNDVVFDGILHDITYRRQMERRVERKLKIENTLAEISTKLISEPFSNETLSPLLSELGKDDALDLVSLIVRQPNGKEEKIEWFNPQCELIPGNSILLTSPQLSVCRKSLLEDDLLYISNLETAALPEEEYKYLHGYGVKSILGAPVKIDGKSIGYLAIFSLQKFHEWDRVEIHLITMLSNIISANIQKETAQAENAKLIHALKISEAKNEAILSVLPDYFFVIDRDLNIRQIHVPAENEWQTINHTLNGKPLSYLFDEIEFVKIETAFASLTEDLPRIKFQGWYPFEGHQIFIEVLLQRLDRFNFLCIVRDHTQDKMAEKRIEESEKQFRSLFGSMSEGLLFLHYHAADDQFLIDEINPAFEDIAGVKSADMLSKPFSEVFPDKGKMVRPLLKRVMITGIPEGAKFNFANENVWWQITAFSTQANAMAIFVQDITRQMLAEKALRENETKLMTAQQLAKLGTWEHFFESDTIRVSANLGIYFNKTIDAPVIFTLQEFLNLVVEPDRDRVETCYRDAVAKGEPFTCIYRIQLSDMKIYTVEAFAVVTYDLKNNPMSAFGTIQDITNRLHSESPLV